MCIDLCLDMCIDLCTDICTDMCLDICLDMCTGMWLDMCADTFLGTCFDMCFGILPSDSDWNTAKWRVMASRTFLDRSGPSKSLGIPTKFLEIHRNSWEFLGIP